MLIFNSLISDPYAGILALIKPQYRDVSSKLELEVLDYIVRGFLWHPEFVYLPLIGRSRIAKLKIEVLNDFPLAKREIIRSFSFPLILKSNDQLHVSNYENDYPLNVDFGKYHVIANARHLTYEEVEDSPKLMEIYDGDVPSDPAERPCNYRISLCKTNQLQAPNFYLRDSEISHYSNEMYVINSNYDVVLLEDSDYEFD